jgi:hypothetical protein
VRLRQLGVALDNLRDSWKPVIGYDEIFNLTQNETRLYLTPASQNRNSVIVQSQEVLVDVRLSVVVEFPIVPVLHHQHVVNV